MDRDKRRIGIGIFTAHWNLRAHLYQMGLSEAVLALRERIEGQYTCLLQLPGADMSQIQNIRTHCSHQLKF